MVSKPPKSKPESLIKQEFIEEVSIELLIKVFAKDINCDAEDAAYRSVNYAEELYKYIKYTKDHKD